MIPKQLQKEGIRFVLLKPRDKAPFENNWSTFSNYAYDDPKLVEYLEKGGNYGILCGSKNLIVIDFVFTL